MSTSTPTYASLQDFAKRQGLNMNCEQIYGLLLVPYVWSIVSAILYVGIKWLTTFSMGFIYKKLDGLNVWGTIIEEEMNYLTGEVKSKEPRPKKLSEFLDETATRLNLYITSSDLYIFLNKSLKTSCTRCGCVIDDEPRRTEVTAADADFSNTEYTSGIVNTFGHIHLAHVKKDDEFFDRVSRRAQEIFRSDKNGGIIITRTKPIEEPIDNEEFDQGSAPVVTADEGDIETAGKAVGLPTLDSCINTCTAILPEPCKPKSVWETFCKSAEEGLGKIAQVGNSAYNLVSGVFGTEEDLERHKGEKINEDEVKEVEEKCNNALKDMLREVQKNMEQTAQFGRRMDVLSILFHRDSPLNRAKDTTFFFGLFPSLDLLASLFVDVFPEMNADLSEADFLLLLKEKCGDILWNDDWEPKLQHFKNEYVRLEKEWLDIEKSLGNDSKLNLGCLLPTKKSDEYRAADVRLTPLRSGDFDSWTDKLLKALTKFENFDEYGGDYRRWRRWNQRSVAVDYEFDYRCAFIEEMKVLAKEAMEQNVLDRWRRDTLIKFRYTDGTQFRGYWRSRFVDAPKAADEDQEELKTIERKFLEMSFRDARKCLEASIALLKKAEAAVKPPSTHPRNVEIFCANVQNILDPLVEGGIRKDLRIDQPDVGLIFWKMNAEQLANVFEMLVSISVFIICCTQIDPVDESKNFGMSSQYQQFYGLLVNSAFVSTFISISIDYVNLKEGLALSERFLRRYLRDRFSSEEEKAFKSKGAKYEDAIILYDMKGAVFEGEAIPGYGASWEKSEYFFFFCLVMAPVACTHILPMYFLFIWIFLMLTLVPIFAVIITFLSMYFVEWLFDCLKKCMRNKNWCMGEDNCIERLEKNIMSLWSMFFCESLSFRPRVISASYLSPPPSPASQSGPSCP